MARHCTRTATSSHSATLMAAPSSNSDACTAGAVKRRISPARVSAHQPAPQTSSSCDKRCRLRADSSAACSGRTTCCRRQAPIRAVMASTAGVQNPAWASGRRPSPPSGANSSGLATRKDRPPNPCSNRPKAKPARCCNCRLSQTINKPLPPHTALALCQGRTKRTAEQLHGKGAEQEGARLQAQANPQGGQAGQGPTDRRGLGVETQRREQVEKSQARSE